MTEPQINTGKALICTFRQLALITRALHQNDKVWLDNLFDIWKLGAPTPNSIIRNPKGYDPRVRQKGNYEARIVFPTALAKWTVQCINARGLTISTHEAFALIDAAFKVASGDAGFSINKPIQITKR